jgi:hypothetical protein
MIEFRRQFDEVGQKYAECADDYARMEYHKAASHLLDLWRDILKEGHTAAGQNSLAAWNERVKAHSQTEDGSSFVKVSYFCSALYMQLYITLRNFLLFRTS